MRELTFVGAVTRDRAREAGKWLAGGAVLYAGAAATALGHPVRVVTVHDDGFIRPPSTDDWTWQCHPSPATTQFENVELGEVRRQWLWQRSSPVDCDRVAMSAWPANGWVVLAPVFDELDLQGALNWCQKLRVGGRCLLPQGWLRAGSGRQWPVEVTPRPRLLEIAGWARDYGVTFDCICLSEAELETEPGVLEILRRATHVLAVTRGARGASLFMGKSRLEVGVITASVRDTTGAGDSFAGALIAGLAQDLELSVAACLASAAAGLSTERVGVAQLDGARVLALASSVTVERFAE
ncbi:MAG: PfkB family carbohydrate kinase [Polyangiaceae bacterium]